MTIDLPPIEPHRSTLQKTVMSARLQRNIDLLKNTGFQQLEGVKINERQTSLVLFMSGEALIRVDKKLPHNIYKGFSDTELDLHAFLRESIELLKEWLGEKYLSRMLISRITLMRLLDENLDKKTFFHVLKNDLTLVSVDNIMKINDGEFDEDLVHVAELPDFLVKKLLED